MFTYFLFADKTSLNSKGIGTTVLSILFILVFLSASFLAAYEGVQPTVILPLWAPPPTVILCMRVPPSAVILCMRVPPSTVILYRGYTTHCYSMPVGTATHSYSISCVHHPQLLYVVGTPPTVILYREHTTHSYSMYCMSVGISTYTFFGIVGITTHSYSILWVPSPTVIIFCGYTTHSYSIS